MTDRRMLVVVVVAAVLGGGVAALWASSQPERYEVGVVLAVGPAATLIDDADVIDVVGSLERGGITATAAGVATSSSVRDAAVADLGLTPGSIGDYEVDSVPVLTSSLVDITVTGPDPEIAASLANAIGAELQARFTTIYEVYEIELLTPAIVPGQSTRPSVLLVAVLGAIVAVAVALVVWWAAFGGRWRVARGDAGEL